MVSSPGWLRTYRPVARPRLRLVCFPHAGAGATAYRGWSELLPPDVELISVCYPGRQDRFGEPFASSVDALAAGITSALAPLSTAPLALFGHSMGAIVAYETAVRLEAGYGLVPRKLFVSGRWAPDHVDDRDFDLDDADLIAHTRRLGNVQADLFELTEIRDLLLSVLRADYSILRNYRRERIHQLSAPIVAYSGDNDPGCSPAHAGEWSKATTGSFDLRIFPGDHFYLVPLARELVRDVIERVDEGVKL